MEGLNINNSNQQLINKLGSKDGLERKEAREKLVDKKEKEVIDPLIELLDHPEHIFRWEAMKTLKHFGDPELIPIFLSKLEEEESDIRWMAAKGLINIGEVAVEPLLRLILKNADSVFVLEGAHHVLNELLKVKNIPENMDIEKLLPLLKSTIMSGKIMSTAYELLNQ